MKNKFFSPKLTVIIFIILFCLGVAFLSTAPKPHVKEVHKEIHLKKQ
jgi:hypothetical protein